MTSTGDQSSFHRQVPSVCYEWVVRHVSPVDIVSLVCVLQAEGGPTARPCDAPRAEEICPTQAALGDSSAQQRTWGFEGGGAGGECPPAANNASLAGMQVFDDGMAGQSHVRAYAEVDSPVVGQECLQKYLGAVLMTLGLCTAGSQLRNIAAADTQLPNIAAADSQLHNIAADPRLLQDMPSSEGSTPV